MILLHLRLDLYTKLSINLQLLVNHYVGVGGPVINILKIVPTSICKIPPDLPLPRRLRG